MKDVIASSSLVANCGLYCGACRSYLKGKCPGCRENHKATWCGVRTCCAENKLGSCGECNKFSDPRQCSKFNNFISRAFALVFNSNRPACVLKIRELGVDGYAEFMAGQKRQSLPRRGA
ncbi:MAG: DUF3795 domain-containing protein [Pseudomonadota bacterium]